MPALALPARQAFGGFARPPFGGGQVVPFRRSGPSPALTKANQAIDGLKARLSQARQNASGKGSSVTRIVLTVGGGAAAGALKAKMPVVPVLNIDSRVALSVVAIGAGLFLVKGAFGSMMIDFGAGVAASFVADYVEDMLDGEATVTVEAA